MGTRNGQFLPNFTAHSIKDRNVWDNENHSLQGNTQWRTMDFDTHSITLEQELFNGRGGLELAFDEQQFETENNLPYSQGGTIGDGNNNDVWIDVSEYLQNGQPNPNVGRPYLKTRSMAGHKHRDVGRESVRATAFYRLNLEDDNADKGGIFKFLGNHTITGYYNKQTVDFFEYRLSSRAQGESISLQRPEYFNRVGVGPGRVDFLLIHQAYVGPSVLGANSPSEVQLQPLQLEPLKFGDSFESLLWNKETESFQVETINVIPYWDDLVFAPPGRRRNEIETEVISLQSRFLDGHIVGLAGWRNDESTTWENVTQAQSEALGIPYRNGQDRWSVRNPDSFRIAATPSDIVSGDTFTWSLVGHMPKNWLGGDFPIGISVHVAESENFQVAPTRRGSRGNVIGLPSGLTKEHGFTLNFLNNALIAKFNWFETESKLDSINATIGTFNWIQQYLQRWDEAARDFGADAAGFQAAVQASIDQLGPQAGDLNNPSFDSYQEVYDEVLSWLPSGLQANRNLAISGPIGMGQVTFNDNPGETVTQDFVAEGFELDITANLTQNWRFFLNASQVEASQSNIAVDFKADFEETFANIKASPIGLWADTPTRAEGQSFESRFVANVLTTLNRETAKDGKPTTELREWRLNAVTTYEFIEGALKGFTVGGGLRWQDESSIGYPNILDETGNAIPDLSNPFWGPSRLNGDLWLSYARPINDKIDWKIQLNYRNAFGDSDSYPVAINPDGNTAVIYNPQPREVFLTNTFRF